MTFKSISKKISLASVALLSALSLSGIASTDNAESAAAKTSNGEVKIHAQQAAPLTPESNQSGTTNDGSAQTVAGGTMANVTFSATPITLTGTPSGSAPDPSDYTADTSRTLNATTDKDGVADFTGLTDGYYLFHQVTTVGGILTVRDFVVNVNTHDTNAIVVNVYPKLNLTPVNDLQKIALTNAGNNFNDYKPDQLVGSKKDDTNQEINKIIGGKLEEGDAGNTTTAGAGDTVTWNLNSIFDASQVTNINNATTYTAGTSYSIIDTLPDGVTYSDTAASLIVSVADNNGDVVGTPLTATDDYTVTISGKIITISLTSAGQLKAAGDGFLNHKTGQINIQLPTTIDAGFVGTATNSFKTDVTNAFGVDISNSTKNNPSVNVGGVEIKKINASDKALTGATFVLVRAKDKDAAKDLVTTNAANIKNDGQTTGLTDKATAEFVKETSGQNKGKIIVQTTDDKGLAAWTGLNLVDSDTNTTNSTNYFAVEIQAPTGYELPSPTTAANVFAVTADTNNTPDDGDETKITNNRPFDLPFTGGTGIAAILLLATVAGIGAIVIRRKKNEENEEVSK